MSKDYSGVNTLTFLITLVTNALKGLVKTSDSRLTDARTPKVHAATHKTGGADALKPSDIDAVAVSDIINALDSDAADKPLSAAQGKELAGRIANAGGGDMTKDVYDTDNDGVVDNAKQLDGHDASYFEQAGTAASMFQDQKGAANGVAPLGADKKINSIYLPGYVDDVVEGFLKAETGFFYEDEAFTQLVEGERGKIYVDLLTDISYRYSGNTYVAITSSDMVEIDNATVQEIWDAAQ